jgi:hypothetical protein
VLALPHDWLVSTAGSDWSDVGVSFADVEVSLAELEPESVTAAELVDELVDVEEPWLTPATATQAARKVATAPVATARRIRSTRWWLFEGEGMRTGWRPPLCSTSISANNFVRAWRPE